MPEIVAHNSIRVAVNLTSNKAAPLQLMLRHHSNDKGMLRAFLTLDEASEIAAILSNLIDHCKRG